MEQLLTLYSEVQSTDVRWLWYCNDSDTEEAQHPARQAGVEWHDGG